MFGILPGNLTRPKEIKETIESCAEKIVKDRGSKAEVIFNGRKYNVSIKNYGEVRITRQDKSWYKSFGDIFSRGFTRGQRAFTPRAEQLKEQVLQKLYNKTWSLPVAREKVTTEVCIRPGQGQSATLAIGDNSLSSRVPDSSTSHPSTMDKTAARQEISSSPRREAPALKPTNQASSTGIRFLAKEKIIGELTNHLSSNLRTFNNKLAAGLAQQERNNKSMAKPGPWLPPEVNRFKDIKALSATAVHPELNANKILINKKPVAIACQYPTQSQQDTYLKMLADNRTPCLVVLASDKEIKNSLSYKNERSRLEPYFYESNQGVSVANFPGSKTHRIFLNAVDDSSGYTGQREAEGTDLIESWLYNLTTKNSNNEEVTIPVIHVSNWPDRESIPTSALKNLVKRIDDVVTEKKREYAKESTFAADDDNALPVIHCRAGVGRTGMVIAGYAMHKDNNLNMEKVIKDMRASRNTLMVQTEPQLKTLVDLSYSEGWRTLA